MRSISFLRFYARFGSGMGSVRVFRRVGQIATHPIHRAYVIESFLVDMLQALPDILLIGYECHHEAHLFLIVSDEAVGDSPFAVFLSSLLNELNQIGKVQMRCHLSIFTVGSTSVNTGIPDGLLFCDSHYSPTWIWRRTALAISFGSVTPRQDSPSRMAKSPSMLAILVPTNLAISSDVASTPSIFTSDSSSASLICFTFSFS